MSQALYRRYRPETFADVIGQGHVTEPLQQALRNDRAHHAYLFSGPRGCGKTTSARILARCLNCVQGPTPTPCGVCPSCEALGTGGPGSLDVIEIDAASHGGVDDARELRERAFYAPASSRYKIYIIDEAHMVSREGFNALLKLVEEPPEHVKFVFATTEPDKVIATIRSRTHHYPFRLVAPGELLAYLATLSERENVTIAPGVLQLVVRAGRGSVRDSLSVLDQLMAGADDAGVTYALALSLLGFTDASLLDDSVEAFAATDAAAVFGIVDRVVEAGHDPRRFAEDLLERLRDLIIIEAAPEGAASILSEHPADELERMRLQAAHFGATELSRAADIINSGLTEMRGATAPRLQLELMCARVLLPGADDAERGVGARLDRIERRLSIMGTAGGAPADTATAPAPARQAAPAAAVPAAGPAGSSATGVAPTTVPPVAAQPVAAQPVAAQPVAAQPVAAQPVVGQPVAAQPVAAQPAVGQPAAAQPAGDTPGSAVADPPPAAPAQLAEEPANDGAIDLTTVRRMWPDVLEVVKGLRRFTWTLLSHNAQVAALDGGRLTLAMVNAGARDSFARGGSDEIVREALIQVLGVDWKVEAIVDPSAAPSGSSPGSSVSGSPSVGSTSGSTAGPPEPSGRAAAMGRLAAGTGSAATAGGPSGAASGQGADAGGPASSYAGSVADAEPSPDDDDVDDRDDSHQDLLARELGARVIGEYDNS